nr:disease resistance protein RPP13-like [Ziziphus jujuba var. spinosa]
MNAFLKDSEGKQHDHYMVEALINQIRDTVYEAEDVINTYTAHLIKLQRRKLLKRRRNVEEEDVVGFGDDTTKLVNQLTDEGRLQREVISIIGMGGLGKTTLTRKIYNNAHIKNHFHCCARVNVSQEYTTRVLLLGILKRLVQISDAIYKMSDEELKVPLRDNLKGKRYFIVMDDVWEPRFWDEIKACFPNDLNGSRILITSQEKEVASHASSTPPYFLPFLDKDTSWELLCKKVFQGEKCPSKLESLGRTLAESCKGLPLSIVVLGGILANKEKSYRIWYDFIGKVNWFLMEDKKRCSDILALSYNHLPRKLRLCFLYVGVFRKDYVIPTATLTQLWVAEGLISIQNDRRNINDFDIAEYYLEELIDQSLIQVASRRSDGGVKTCRIHDLLRDMCIKMSIQEKFYELHVNIAGLRSSNSHPRRLSMLESLHYLQILKLEDVKLGQGLDYLYPSKLTKITFVSCKSLDSNDMKVLGKLANLRILKIRACDMKWSRLYIMAGGFSQLEVFKMIDLNIETWELEEHAVWNLQHLTIEGWENLRNLPDELWSLTNLRMVEVLEIQTDLKEKLMKELEMNDGCKLIIN